MRALALLALSLTLLAAAAVAQQTGARAFLDALYRPYLGKNYPGQALDRPERYFTPALAQAIDRDSREAARRKEPPALDGDPFVQAQDWDVRDLVIEARENGQRATGTVTFKNQGTPRRLTLDLLLTPAGWRIDDIRTTDSSLRALLKVR